MTTIALEMPAGSVVFYPGTLLHGGGANTTDRPRLGVILEYAAAWIRPQENHVLGVPKSVVRQLPERLAELLGYNVYPPFIGNVDGRHPRKYLTDDARQNVGRPARAPEATAPSYRVAARTATGQRSLAGSRDLLKRTGSG